MASSNEWEQYYQKSFNSNNSTTSHNNNGGQLTPTGSVAKPIRRRSRVSKKTPITLLNANANNFRALVQELTGCTAASSTSISFGNRQKGPINLSFGNPNYSYNEQQQQQQQKQKQQQQQQQRQPLLQVQQNQMHEEEQKQQHVYSFDGDRDHVFHYSSNSSSNSGYYDAMQYGMEMIGDGFEVMDLPEDISLHELLD